MCRVRSRPARFIGRTHQAAQGRERKMIRKILAAFGVTAAIALASTGVAGSLSVAAVAAPSGITSAASAGPPWG